MALSTGRFASSMARSALGPQVGVRDLLVMALFAGALPACASTELAFGRRTVVVAPGVTAYLGGFSNAVTVDTGMGLLLVDTKMDIGLLAPGKALRDVLRARGEHVRWIAVTHPHVDHVDGLRDFADDPEVEQIMGAPLDASFALPGATKFIPVVGDQTRTLVGIDVRFVTFAHAHTGGDLAVWLPASGVAIVGDLVPCGYLPNAEYEDGGSYQGLLTASRTIQALRPNVVVGGHGGVCSGDDLDRYVTYLERAINLGAPETPAPYASIRLPLRTISSQDKLLRCSKLERDQGPWSQVPVVDRDQQALRSSHRHCQ